MSDGISDKTLRTIAADPDCARSWGTGAAMATELLAARAALAAADALAKAVREDDDACRGGSSAPSLAVMDALALYRAARGAR